MSTNVTKNQNKLEDMDDILLWKNNEMFDTYLNIIMVKASMEK